MSNAYNQEFFLCFFRPAPCLLVPEVDIILYKPINHTIDLVGYSERNAEYGTKNKYFKSC